MSGIQLRIVHIDDQGRPVRKYGLLVDQLEKVKPGSVGAAVEATIDGILGRTGIIPLPEEV